MAENTIDIAAVKKLAGMIGSKDSETVRAGNRELWQMVRRVGRPGNDQQKKDFVDEVLKLIGKDQPTAVRREAVWMLSELAGDEVVDPVAALLADSNLGEDVRMVLQRLPGAKSLEALKAGLAAAPENFKVNIAESLRTRGVTVPGLPDQKLTPCRPTKVMPNE